MPSITYTPTPVGFGLEARIAGSISGCELGLQSTVRFSTTGYSLHLRLPEHGEGVDNDLRLITHRNRSNILFVYARGTTTQSIPGLIFIGIEKTTLQLIQTFIQATRGMKMQYFDAWGDVYTGIISSWSWKFVQRKKGYEVTINFECE